MSGTGLTYPFTAVCGLEDAKAALLCAVVSPGIRTVLIRGPAGTAKTVLARSLGDVCGREVVNLPLNATDEQVFGGMDVDSTIRDGRPSVQEGLLSKADGGILYVDDANLLDRRMLSSILDCVLTGKVVLEREGVSAEYRFDTVLVATMNPVHSGLSPHLLDRFDLCAVAEVPSDMKAEVLRRNMDFQDDPDGFRALYSDREAELRGKVRSACLDVTSIHPDDPLITASAMISGSVGAEGFRGDLALVNAAVALAALDGRASVGREDIRRAALLALVHRRRYVPEDGDRDTARVEAGDYREEDRETASGNIARAGDPGDDMGEVTGKSLGSVGTGLGEVVNEIVFEIGEQFRVIDLFEEPSGSYRKTSARKGGRALVESSDGTGRYARSRIPEGTVSDLAFDATVRAAAPYQRGRDHDGLSVSIAKQDIRLKVRERRSGCTILFLVDSSGSLGLSNRMSAVKGAVLSMLRDSYVKRDRIGMMAFRQDTAELILPPTKSVEYSYKMLGDLPTGGRTPLSGALVTVRDYMTSYSSSHPGEDCYIVLITDGIGNVPLRKGADPNVEARKLASTMSIPQVRWIVIDTGSGLTMFKYAEALAAELGATYLKLKDLNADRLADSVRGAIRGSGR